MKTILLLSDSINDRVEYFINLVKSDYEVLVVDNETSFQEVFNLSFDNIAAAIIDTPSDKENVDDIFQGIKSKNNYMYAVPVLILTDVKNADRDEQFLERCAGIIYKGESKKVVLTRIEKSSAFSNSASFQDFSEMLKSLPSLIYLKDTHGRYVFCSQYWSHLEKDGNDEFTIRGKTDLDIRKDKINAMKAYNSDLKIVKTGEGMSYIVKEKDADGNPQYLQVIKEPLKKANGKVSGIIAIVNNVTEQELLRQELRKKSITDVLTGLYNRVYFEEYTSEIMSKDIFPLSIISADCDDLKVINDQFGHAAGDQYISLAAKLLSENLPKSCVIFRMGGDEFLVILPNTPKETADGYIDKLIELSHNYKTKDFDLQISLGVHTTETANNSIDKCIALSDESMYKAKKNKKSNK